LRAALSDSDNPENLFQPPTGASPDLIAMQRQFLAQRRRNGGHGGDQDRLACYRPSFLAAFLLGGLFLSVLTMSSSEQGFS